jgi:hypothetical protein
LTVDNIAIDPSGKLQIRVLAGHARSQAGTIRAVQGMRTSQGTIDRITPSGTVIIGSVQYRKPYKQLTVSVSEARRFGFGNSGSAQPQTANAAA